jgi:maltose phosphorylase
MAGTWLAIVEGFGGMQILNNHAEVKPLIPQQWKSYSFRARFRGVRFEVKVTHKNVIIRNLSRTGLKIVFAGKVRNIPVSGSGTFPLNE